MKKTNKLTITAMCLALGIIIPQATHFLAEFASKISLMHIPVYVAGIICGPLYGLFVGVFSPLFSMLFFNMPKVPSCYSMMIELGAYGLFSGLLFKLIKTKSNLFNIYSSLIISMLIGKLIEASNEFSTSGKAVASLTAEMMNIVNGLKSIWQGSAATEYAGKFNSLQDDIEKINRIIDEHVNDLNQMAIEYEKAEERRELKKKY